MIETPLVIGINVITEIDRTRLGKVAALVCDSDRRLMGLLIGGRGILRREMVLPINNIITSSKDNIVAREKNSLVKKSDVRFREAMERSAIVIGATVVDEAGVVLGRTVAAKFNPGDGELAELTVSKGTIAALTGGRQLFKSNQIKGWQGESVVISAAADEIVSLGGLKAKVSSFGARLGQLRGEADRIISTREARFAVGKTADRDIFDGQGLAIVKAGDIVTDDHIKIATKEDRLHQLALAVGAGSAKKSWRQWTEPGATGDQAALESESLKETQTQSD